MNFLVPCVPYSENACRVAAERLGLLLGGGGYNFVGNFKQTKGCYAYTDGDYIGRVYYGTGGTEEQMKASPDASEHRYRPHGYDCAGGII